ncbi:hypothetical protein [Aquabacter cavernae]|nr:hypothetical protein [Aquabacter cavernae]
MLRKLAVTASVVTILGVAAYFAPQETGPIAQAGAHAPIVILAA